MHRPQDGIKINQSVLIWLGGLLVLLIAMILLGAATRLTDSGLSITRWDLFRGILPPITEQGWQDAFKLYQQTTEFQTINFDMDLKAFRQIFWWEWAHRFLGRFIGLWVLLPGLFFWWRGSFSMQLKRAFLFIFLGVCLQGAIGWWMVASGLNHRVDVAPCRLMIHLTAAFLLLAYVKWIFLGTQKNQFPKPVTGNFIFFFLILILIQIALGALVAGTDAGKHFTDWPLMNGQLLVTPYFHPEYGLASLFEWAGAVQFNHRLLAYLILVLGLGWYLWQRRTQKTPFAPKLQQMIIGLLLMQMLLGILTLVFAVPFWLGLAHQLGAILLMLSSVAYWHRLSQTPTE